MISIKRLATVGIAAGLLAASAMPVLADDDVDIAQKNEDTEVNNDIDAWSDTGNNKIETGSGDIKKSDITTGNADTTVKVKNYVNKNKVNLTDCDCFDDVDIDQKNKNTKVKNIVVASSDTGNNKIETASGDIKKSDITTGNATNTTTVKTTVNKNVVVVGP